MSIIQKVKYYWNRRNGDAYIKYLRSKGIKIGTRCEVQKPVSLNIDTTRPTLLSIGNHVYLHRGLTIMTHDWASWVFLDKYHDFVPSHAKVTIGNNVWFGEFVTVLKGVQIGDNCIIGAGSIVTKDIPGNSVAVGVPAKEVSSIDDYYEKRKRIYPAEAKEYVNSLNGGAKITDFYDDYPLFVDRENVDNYSLIPYLNVFKDVNSFNAWLSKHKKTYDSFEHFWKFNRENG